MKAETLMACDECGLTFAFPLPSAAVLDEYNRHYWTEAHGGLKQTKLAWVTDAGLNAARARYIVDRIGTWLPRDLRMLEIGPGRGYLLAQIRRLGACAAYDVVESDASCHDALATHGATVFASVEEVAAAAARYQLIVLSHVLEHTADPKAFIEPLVAMLAPGGFLFVETPCRDHTFKSIHEPHLMFFDKQPMAALMDRVRCDVVTMSYHGPPLETLAAPRGFARRVRDAVWTRAAELMLTARNIDALDSQVLRRYVRHLDPESVQSTPSWWLRTLAVKRSFAQTS